jgi:hypothetical protein
MKPTNALRITQLIVGNLLAVFLLFLIAVFLHYPLLLNAPLVLQFDEGIQASGNYTFDERRGILLLF